MSTLLICIVAAAALLTGALLGALLTHLRAARRIEALRVALATAQARLEAGALQDADRLSLLEQSETRLRAAFDSLAGETLRTNSELFLRLAREALGRDQAVAAGALKEREVAIAALVDPLRSALERTEAQVQALERERREAFTALRTQIETLAGSQAQLQRETRNLVTALRRPEVRGRWGELTLRRLVELAGLSEHCDFTEQLQLVGGEGALRPDLVVHLPDARDLVIDAKTPLDAYLAALDAATDEERAQALRRHAQQVETRVRELASKNYWAQFERSPEFAVLFLPGDQFLSAALAERPELLETALGQRVIIATPSTLIALLKAVAYGWRQSAVAHNAAQIRDLGQELYRRLSTFNGHLGRMGQRLSTAVEAYNAAVGSLERQVLPQARRFVDLGVTADAPLAPLEPVGQLVRNPSAPGAAEAPATALRAQPPARVSPAAAPARVMRARPDPGGTRALAWLYCHAPQRASARGAVCDRARDRRQPGAAGSITRSRTRGSPGGARNARAAPQARRATRSRASSTRASRPRRCPRSQASRAWSTTRNGTWRVRPSGRAASSPATASAGAARCSSRCCAPRRLRSPPPPCAHSARACASSSCCWRCPPRRAPAASGCLSMSSSACR